MEVTSEDYEIKDIVYRNGGVSVITYIPSLNKIIYVNNCVDAFERMTEFEIKHMVEESVDKFLHAALRETTGDTESKVQAMKDKLVGAHTLTKNRG
jgi:hypothetical protein